MKRTTVTFVGGAVLAIATATSAMSAEIITTLDGSQGWRSTDTRPGGDFEIVDLAGMGGNLENNQPAGTGAVKLTTDSTNAAKAEVGVVKDFGKVSDILNGNFSLSYSWFDTGGAVAAPSLKLAFYSASFAGDGYGQLIYEPYAQGVDEKSYITPTHGDWVTASVDLNNGRFWNTGMFGVASSYAGPPNYTLGEWLSEFDAEFSDASLVGLSLGIGSYNPDETGYVDWVSISGTEADGTYDFEAPAAVPLPASLPLILLGMGAFGLARGRRRA